MGKTQTSSIRVGIGGWKFEPWRETFYPETLAQKDELHYASRKMSAIEVNSTFYAPQRPATYAKWRGETPDGFMFSLKAPRFVTQQRTLANAKRGIGAFVFGGLAELGDRLGPISWQLAPQRVFDVDDLAAFLELLPRDLNGYPLRHAVEVRNDSFMCKEYVQLARAHEVATVFTDSPDYPSFADATADFTYARLMKSRANLRAGYASAALDTWATRAREWAQGRSPAGLHYVEKKPPASGARDVFVYFIGSAKERNPGAAMALRERLRD